MSRLPALVFAALTAATVGAFFLVQHLKVTTPLVANPSPPTPAAINPVSGRVCGGVDHRRTSVSFYLLHRSDNVDVYVIDQSGAIVATLASNRFMPGGQHPVREVFRWDGRQDNGRPAPDGLYRVQVDLVHQGRTVLLTPRGGSSPYTIKVETRPPRPVVTSVVPRLIPQGPRTVVAITYRNNEGHIATVRLYRTDLPGRPQLLSSFLTPPGRQQAAWNGQVDDRPAPAGTYLVGLDVTDAACNTGHFPATMPPAPGTTGGAGVSVRYLDAQVPLTPVVPGTSALVSVDADGRPYRWSLNQAGSPKPAATGSGSDPALRVPVPRGPGDLYELALRSGSYSTTVPLVTGGEQVAPVLVVLPTLTWQGLNPIDDTGDGLPSTLARGVPVRLARPLVDGLPAGFEDEAALVHYLTATHRPFALTTDVALMRSVARSSAGRPVTGQGSSQHPVAVLSAYHGVLLAGSERWLSPALATALRGYVNRGGHVLSLGPDSLRAYVTVGPDEARHPTPPAATDIFGVHHGSLAVHGAGTLSVFSDGLGLFASAPATFSGSGASELITGAAPPAQLLSTAGSSPSSVSIAGVALGRGTVVEVGLSGFPAAPATNLHTRELFAGLWSQLAR